MNSPTKNCTDDDHQLLKKAKMPPLEPVVDPLVWPDKMDQ